MKSKFDGIVKVKKQELDFAESALIKAKDSVKQIQESIKVLLSDISSLKTPQKGDFLQMQKIRQTLLMLRSHKEHLDRELTKANLNLQKFQKVYENAHMEHEKMLYLKDQELAEKLKALQRQEQLDMDETALQLFAGNMK